MNALTEKGVIRAIYQASQAGVEIDLIIPPCLGNARAFGELLGIDGFDSWTAAERTARLKEAQNINSSLLTLGQCMQSLATTNKHVPYRDSKLTYLLQVDSVQYIYIYISQYIYICIYTEPPYSLQSCTIASSSSHTASLNPR